MKSNIYGTSGYNVMCQNAKYQLYENVRKWKYSAI
jgi:hypothetical protein